MKLDSFVVSFLVEKHADKLYNEGDNLPLPQTKKHILN